MGSLAPENTIQDLPTETLLMILKYLFWASCVETTCPCVDPEEWCFCRKGVTRLAWAQDEDLLKHSIYPYATSLVCKRWYALMRSDPSFWTRIVIILDEDPTPLLKIQSQIDLSAGLPLDVHIVRRSKIRDLQEHARSRPIIDFLRPHLYQCRVVAFDLMHNSSLPSITHDLRREAPHLVKLQLRCHIDDGQEYMARPPFRGGSDEDFSHFPRLEVLDIDGKNFGDCCMDGSYWEDNLSESVKLVVTISNYTPVSNGVVEPCTLGSFWDGLASIPYISELHLANVQFPDNGDDWNNYLSTKIPYIELKDLDPTFTKHHLENPLLEESYPHHLRITRCVLPDVQLYLSPVHLMLEQVLHDDDGLSLFLTNWEGTTLELVDMTSFNDSAIQALLSASTPGRSLTPQLRHLIITDCPNFTATTLIKFITSQNKIFLQNNTSNLEPVLRCTLDVSGRGFPLSAEDSDWFYANLDSFHWNTNHHD